MPIKVNIPGVGEVSFPDDMTEEQILRDVRRIYNESQQVPEEQPAGRDAIQDAIAAQRDPNQSVDQRVADARQVGNEMLRPVDKASIPLMAARKTADNLLNTPEVSGTLLAGGTGFAQTVAGTVPQFFDDEDMSVAEGFRSFGDRFNQNFEREKQQFPASALRAIDLPDTYDIQAGVQTGMDVLSGESTEGIGQRFAENRDELVNRALDTRAEQPYAAAFGDAFGDALTLASIRRPGAIRARNARIEASAAKAIAGREASTVKGFKVPEIERLPDAIKNTIDDVVNDEVTALLKRGGMRVAETGFNGAILAAMNDADPLTGAAIAAGQQAVGSALLTGGKGLLGGGGRNAALGAVGLIAYMQMFLEVTPGGRDRILESTESAFKKIGALATLGVIAGLAGSGRISGKTADRFPGVADAITALPRGSVQSFLREFARRDDQDFIESVFFKMGSDPDYFGPTARRRLERAMYHPDISPIQVIDNLRGDPQFRRAVARMNED